eukprot:9416729-Pyramimonas_sp.AAC.2
MQARHTNGPCSPPRTYNIRVADTSHVCNPVRIPPPRRTALCSPFRTRTSRPEDTAYARTGSVEVPFPFGMIDLTPLPTITSDQLSSHRRAWSRSGLPTPAPTATAGRGTSRSNHHHFASRRDPSH